MRRVKPRGATIVQRIANYTRRLVRRGMPYSLDFDPPIPTIRSAGCSAISSARTSGRSSTRSCATDST
jgi:hypothetical protein